MDKESKKILEGKIFTIKNLINKIGNFPRKNKVIMCHGTFDIVHPGHIRHLMFAKSKANFLIVSLTADKHIKKGNLRPYVPQEMRAYNLAALQFVDYVIIDENETPLENIQKLKPDYFAKGYEYGGKIPIHKTQEEINVIKQYGGEILFTPGDIVYSSSEIIKKNRPILSLEKLLFLMNAEGISFDDLRNSLKKISKLKAHIVGDTIVDSYTRCSMIGGMTKTPTMSVKFENKTDYLGGAGIVAKHIKAAGADVVFSTVIGIDAYADFVKSELKKAKIKANLVVDKNRPTTNKNAIVVADYRLLKVDTLDNTGITGNILESLSKKIKNTDSDILIFSDFRHGIFNQNTIPILSSSIPIKQFKVADSQVASRWGNICEFQKFDLITPNEREARFALGDQDSVIRPLAYELKKKSRCKTLILKCGDKGIITYRSLSERNPRAFFNIDSFVDRLVDPVGAGDALLAYSSLVLKATDNDVIASIVGNIAAGLECEQDGNHPISAQEVIKKIDYLESQSKFDEVLT
jgi:rfaE bifunctional protein kinase chain/domain/rfaE bifunctional protein nucleotidyltransferase chain/domain